MEFEELLRAGAIVPERCWPPSACAEHIGGSAACFQDGGACGSSDTATPQKACGIDDLDLISGSGASEHAAGAYYEISEEDFDRLLRAGHLFPAEEAEGEAEALSARYPPAATPGSDLERQPELAAYEVSEAEFERLLLAGALCEDLSLEQPELNACRLPDARLELPPPLSREDDFREASGRGGLPARGAAPVEDELEELLRDVADSSTSTSASASSAPAAADAPLNGARGRGHTAPAGSGPRPPAAPPPPAHRQQRPRWERRLPGDKLVGQKASASGAGTSQGTARSGGGLFFLPTDSVPLKRAGSTPSPASNAAAAEEVDDETAYAQIRGQASAAGSPLHSARLLRGLRTPPATMVPKRAHEALSSSRATSLPPFGGSGSAGSSPEPPQELVAPAFAQPRRRPLHLPRSGGSGGVIQASVGPASSSPEMFAGRYAAQRQSLFR
eukprot:TRINITY_DN25582_c0_g1_i1.p1 TRINITY_DN25582_c0_g1~~TRINITY_DN25582_c0_g1_i1.p1  ORF type:complete len:484 (+),score=113.68 TRINITY_DN25582_c0_g1_i1:120-1454(+)